MKNRNNNNDPRERLKLSIILFGPRALDARGSAAQTRRDIIIIIITYYIRATYIVPVVIEIRFMTRNTFLWKSNVYSYIYRFNSSENVYLDYG